MTKTDFFTIVQRSVAFYRSSYIVTLCEPVVITTARKHFNGQDYIAEAFVLYPKVRDRQLTRESRSLNYTVDAEAVDIYPVRLRREQLFRCAAALARQLIDDQRGRVVTGQLMPDPTLSRACELRRCGPQIVLDLWMRGFTRSVFEDVRRETGSQALRAFLDFVFQYPRVLEHANPYAQWQNL